MQHRRQYDEAPAVLVARAATAPSGFQATPAIRLFTPARDGTGGLSTAVGATIAPLVVLDAGPGGLLLVTGAELRRIPRESADSIADIAASEAAAWRRRYALAASKQRFAEGFVTYVETLNRATAVAEVYDALLHYTPHLIGGYGAVLMLPHPTPDGTIELRAVPNRSLSALPLPLAAEIALPRPVPGPIARSETLPGMSLAPLAPLFGEAGARQLAAVAIGMRALLLLLERRGDREFSGEDWFRLQTVARHAECLLERLQLIDEQRRIGVTNQRKM